MSGELQRICVIGLAASGAAVARYAAARIGEEYSEVAAFDGAASDRLGTVAEELRALGVRVVLDAAVGDGDWDVCVASPGIPPHAPISVWAREHAARVISEIEYAFERSSSPWIAITGTNGKTTTTSLVAHLLEMGGMPADTVGNIGTPAIERADAAGPGRAIVAEVSSFQLAGVDRFCPRVAVLLNITPDHLDWHGSMESYAADKTRIFENMSADDTAVIDVDDAGSAPYADRLAERGIRVVRVSRRGVPSGGAGVGDDGCLALDTPAGSVSLLTPEDLRIRGDHNVSNALAAAAAAHAFGVSADDLRAGLRTFAPIEHRLEPCGVVGGVEFFNDSKATNPDAVLKALTAFSDRPIIVLLGGRNKGNDFSELAEAVVARAKAAILFGEAGAEMEPAFAGVHAHGATVRRVASMADALRAAQEIAVAGDAVVLSPACASFDEFANYTERGRVFKHLVAELGEG